MLGFGIADIKEKLQQIRTEWRENTDKQRFYFFVAFFLLLLLISFPSIFRGREPSGIIIGLLGASVIFLFHEYMRLRFLEFKDNDNLTTVWVGVMDLLIAAPMIGYGTSSQMYTALLVRIVMLSMGLWFFSRLYVKGARYVKMSEEEVKELEKEGGDPPIIKYTPWKIPDHLVEKIRAYGTKSAHLQTLLMAIPLYLIAGYYILFMISEMIRTVLFFLLGDYPIGLKSMIGVLSIVCQ